MRRVCVREVKGNCVYKCKLCYGKCITLCNYSVLRPGILIGEE